MWLGNCLARAVIGGWRTKVQGEGRVFWQLVKNECLEEMGKMGKMGKMGNGRQSHLFAKLLLGVHPGTTLPNPRAWLKEYPGPRHIIASFHRCHYPIFPPPQFLPHFFFLFIFLSFLPTSANNRSFFCASLKTVWEEKKRVRQNNALKKILQPIDHFRSSRSTGKCSPVLTRTRRE